jgi:hypothetical protein
MSGWHRMAHDLPRTPGPPEPSKWPHKERDAQASHPKISDFRCREKMTKTLAAMKLVLELHF